MVLSFVAVYEYGSGCEKRWFSAKKWYRVYKLAGFVTVFGSSSQCIAADLSEFLVNNLHANTMFY
jgi:hypothetical protein